MKTPVATVTRSSPRPSKMVMAMHAAALLRKHGIERVGARTVNPKLFALFSGVVAQGCANTQLRLVCHPPIRSTRSYLVALHEIGHVVLGHGLDVSEDAQLWQLEAREAEANDWARENMLPGAWDEACDLAVSKILTSRLMQIPPHAVQLELQLGLAWFDFLPPATSTRYWTQLGWTYDEMYSRMMGAVAAERELWTEEELENAKAELEAAGAPWKWRNDGEPEIVEAVVVWDDDAAFEEV